MKPLGIILILVTNQELVLSASFIKLLPISKKFQFELQPFKSFSLLLENLPFGKFELKHSIEKRETESGSPAVNEIPIVPVENQKIPVQTVVITEPVISPPPPPIPEEPPKGISFILPWNPEFLITPNQEPIKETPAPVVPAEPAPVVEEPPKPVEVVITPVKSEPVSVLINPAGESLIPPPSPPPPPSPVPAAPVFKIEEPKITPLLTDISKIPLYSFPPGYPFPIMAAPVPPVLQEVVVVPPTTVPPPPLPPPPKEEPPVLAPPKVEYPSYLVKGSKLILFFGTKILRMLSKFIEGGVSQISTMPSFPLPEE